MDVSAKDHAEPSRRAANITLCDNTSAHREAVRDTELIQRCTELSLSSSFAIITTAQESESGGSQPVAANPALRVTEFNYDSHLSDFIQLTQSTAESTQTQHNSGKTSVYIYTLPSVILSQCTLNMKLSSLLGVNIGRVML